MPVFGFKATIPSIYRYFQVCRKKERTAVLISRDLVPLNSSVLLKLVLFFGPGTK